MKKQKNLIVLLILLVLLSFMSISTFAEHENITVVLDGEELAFDVQPTIINGRTMVPLRAIFEALGAEVYWDDATQTIEAQKDYIWVNLAINSPIMYVNFDPITLDVPATLINGRTLVPVRAISEAFNCNVQWDDATSTVSIFSEDYIDLSQITSNIETIYVTTADEFINAIGNNKKIVLTSNYYNLSDIEQFDNPFVVKNEYLDQYTITNVVNLTITGNAEIAIDDLYANVLDFDKCAYVTLDGLTVGHSVLSDNYGCGGYVVAFSRCESVDIKNSNLYGCGAVGIHAYDTNNLNVSSTNIYDCSDFGISLGFTTASINWCSFYNCNFYSLANIYDSTVKIVNCSMHDLVCYNEFIYNYDWDSSSSITVEACTIENTSFYSLSNTESQNLTFKNCSFNNNSGIMENTTAFLDNCAINNHEESQDAISVKWLSDRQIWYDSETDCFILVFSLKDEYQETELAAPANVSITITNNNNEIVYEDTLSVTKNDFGYWYYNNGTIKKYQCAISIPRDSLTKGTSDSGKIVFDIVNAPYFSFYNSELSIYDNLPIKETTIILPQLPIVTHEYSYDDSVLNSCKITNISYNIGESYSTLSFSGEKIYSHSGDNKVGMCSISWSLYDSEGYVIKSGTLHTPGLKTGEKFRNVESHIYANLKPGETYYLLFN